MLWLQVPVHCENDTAGGRVMVSRGAQSAGHAVACQRPLLVSAPCPERAEHGCMQLPGHAPMQVRMLACSPAQPMPLCSSPMPRSCSDASALSRGTTTSITHRDSASRPPLFATSSINVKPAAHGIARYKGQEQQISAGKQILLGAGPRTPGAMHLQAPPQPLLSPPGTDSSTV